MLDKEKISFIIEEVEIYIEKFKKRKNFDDETIFLASSMIVFQILNRTIDLGDEILRGKKLGFPTDTKDIFNILGKNSIIKNDLSKNLKALVTLRNKFAHRDGKIEKENLKEFAEEDIKNVREFIDLIKIYLREELKWNLVKIKVKQFCRF